VGIPTVVIQIRAFRHIAERMTLPRVVVTRHLLGRPLGPPHDAGRHHHVLRAALELLDEARAGGTIVELPEPYRPGIGGTRHGGRPPSI
jgi:hypothetical protein